MATVTEFDAMSDRCIAAGEAVMKHGSEDLQAAMRVLLAVLGQEIASRLSPPFAPGHRYPATRPAVPRGHMN